MARFLISGLLCLWAQAAGAQQWPPVVEIRFEGNEVTQPKTMLREMPISVGQPADPKLIARSRQAVQDLGLFRKVDIRQSENGAGVVLTVSVEEKIYLLPLPRVEANTDEEFGYGAQLRWSNVAGLNHRLSAFVVRRELKEEDRDASTSYSLGYSAPFVFDTPYELVTGFGHSEDKAVRDGVAFDESFDSVRGLLFRNYGKDNAASQGLQLGGGLKWQNQNTSGVGAPPAYGMSTALVAQASYRDERFNIYSDTGQSWSLGYEIASPDIASDYGYAALTAGYARRWEVGDIPFQTAHFFAQLGSYHGGPQEIEAFSLGGASTLRGYESDFVEGDFLYRLAGEYLRPVGWDWLRLLVVLEAGNVFEEPKDFSLDKVFVSLGLGLRIRFTYFVNFDVELGVAMPLVDGDGLQVFGGGV